MYKVALVCQHGASTGMFAAKLNQAAKNKSIDLEAKAYPDSQIDEIISNHDILLLGPQVGFKKDIIVKQYSSYAKKIYVIDSLDFGMMNGEKVLGKIIEIMEANKYE